MDFEKTKLEVEKKTEQKISRADLLSYLMYPEVFLKFASARLKYGNMEILPTPQFFYGVEKGQEIAVELEPGKILVVNCVRFSTSIVASVAITILKTC